MRPTYGKNVFRTISGSFGRFIAIFAIVALGVAFLAGLLSSTPDMRYSFDQYFDDAELFDLRIMGGLGLTNDDLDALRAVEGVEAVQGAYLADVLLHNGGEEDYAARLHSLVLSGAALNRPRLDSGRFPQKAGECAIVNIPFSGSTIEIGDILKTSENDKNADELLSVTEYTVVGFVDYSLYFSAEKEYTNIGSGTVDLFLLVPNSSFSTDFYTDVYLTAKGAKALDSLTESYRALADETASRVRALSGERSLLRYDTFMAEMREKLAEAQEDYDAAEAEAKEKLADAEAELANAQRRISSGEKQLADGRTQLEENEKQLAENEIALAEQERSAREQFEAAEQQLADAQSTLDDQTESAQQALVEGTRALESYALSSAQLQAFNSLRALPARYTGLTDELLALQTKSDRLEQVGLRLAELAALPAVEQAKYASETAALRVEQETLETEIAATMSGEGYAAFIRGATSLALTGATDKTLPVLALKLGAADAAGPQLEAAQQQLDAQKAALTDQKASVIAQLGDARAQLADGKAQLKNAKAELVTQQARLADARAELAEGRETFDSEKAKAEQELEEAAWKLADAEEQLDDTHVPSWTVSTREDLISYASIMANIDKVSAIAKIFPFFFFLVAALVALTTMTRMVEDERLQIGTMKALGYSRATIMGKYLLYAFMASVLGSILGVCVGLWLFPGVIWNAYTMMYELPRFYYLINWPLAFGTSGAVIACTLLATLNACRATLKEKPAQLMLARAPQPGKRVLLERVGFIWRRLRFTHKVTARNLFRYKKRFLMTTIGVAGCTALLVAGFGLHDSFTDIPEKQFGQLQTFDLMAPFETEARLESRQMRAILGDSERISASTRINYENVKLQNDGLSLEISTFIPENAEDLNGFVNFRTRQGGKPVAFAQDSVILTEKVCEVLQVSVGDTVRLLTKDGALGYFTVSGISENYLRNYIYMTEHTYETGMGVPAEKNVLLLRLTETGAAEKTDLGRQLLATGAVSGLSYTANTRDAFSQAIGKIDTIVAVVILSAGALALVVLYNLTNINISERVKEIATIKVLGFTDSEVYAYINRESVLLALIGAAFGLVLGVFLHRYIVNSAELASMMFGRTIKWYSFVYSAALTMAFSVLIDLVMRRKLRHISMVESMKAPE